MLSGDKQAGILITVAVHLTVMIVLLLVSIRTVTRRGAEFILIDPADLPDIETETETEPEWDELTPEDIDLIQRSIDQMMAERHLQTVDYHNITSTRNVDARNTDADQLYADAERLAEALRNGQSTSQDESGDVEIPRKQDGKEDGGKADGPKPKYDASVLSWALEGRRAVQLPVPAYKCYGGGTVTVLIEVSPLGRVVNARVDTATSSNDPCLQRWALSFAKQARFSSSTNAPDPQKGDIIYQFVSQR